MLSIYRASAGSGKTFTLAYEYIKLLLGYKDDRGKYHLNRGKSDRHRSILAVTFTNKATDEMKRRIIHELAVLARKEPGWTDESPYMGQLTRLFECETDEIIRAAGNALGSLLFDFNFFQVSTIDSFFQLILRTFAREADLAGNYEVELDSRGALETGVVEMFRSLNNSESDKERRRLVKWLTTFLLARVKAGETMSLMTRTSTLFKDFVGFIDSVLDEHYMQLKDSASEGRKPLTEFLSDPELIGQFASALSARLQPMLRQISTAMERVLSLANPLRDEPGWKRGVFTQLEDWHKRPSRAELKATLAKIAENPENAFTKAAMKRFAGETALLEALREAAATVVASEPTVRELMLTGSNLYKLGLLGSVLNHTEEILKDSNTFLLSDTNGMLRGIIGDDEAPFIYERIGTYINHYLIDEFQDTSRMQWENLRPLLSEGLSTGNDSLIIGDEKQCIYRFRGSEPTLLQNRVTTELPPDRITLHGTTPEENTNWRSSREVVTFNNEFFGIAAEKYGHSHIYANAGQQISPAHSNHRGYVSLAEVPKTDLKEQGLERMADEIARELSAGYKASDIVVLTRDRKDAVAAIETLVRRTAEDPDFPRFRIISDDSLYIKSAPSVRFIISILRSIDTVRTIEFGENDGESGQRPSHYVDGQAFTELRNRYEYHSSQGAKPHEALRKAMQPDEGDMIPRLEFNDMTCPNLISIVERIIDRCLSPTAREEENMYITALQDLVLDFCSRGSNDLHSFIDWWDTSGNKATVSAPQDDDSLRIMTIHKSKGLEFKCVHIPIAGWKMASFKSPEWFAVPDLPGIPPEITPTMLPIIPTSDMIGTAYESRFNSMVSEMTLDELNVLYVAFTRAVDELIVTYSSGGSDTVGALISETLRRMQPTSESLHEFGAPTIPEKKKARKRTALDPHTTSKMEPYYSLERADLWKETRIEDLPDMDTPRERGSILHGILAQVATISDLHVAIRRLTRAGMINASESEGVELSLMRELERPEVRPWFEGWHKLTRERDMTDSAGNNLRTDRVVWTADGHVDIIDYKFGEERDKSYARQVKRYMSLLRKAGYKNIRGFIWYLDSGRIVTVA